LRARGRNDLQMQIAVIGSELVGQRVHESGIERPGGDPHIVAGHREMDRGPDGSTEQERTEYGHEPGVAQKHPHPASHHVFKRLVTHGPT
jgi:hypothetical protein